MSIGQWVDDDDQPVPNDYRSAITAAARDRNYKFKNSSALDDLNWKLNRMETDWGGYATIMRAKRAVQQATDALLDLRTNIEAVQGTWKTIQQHPAAGQILFGDAITKTGRHKILFALDSILTSPELKSVLTDLAPNKLRRRLPAAAGPIPIDPLVPDLVLLLRRMGDCLEPIPHIKGVRKVVSLDARCVIASKLLAIIRVEFAGNAIRNATMSKLP